MKIRQGFVTNSSSSNFVVAVKGNLEKVLRDNFAPYYSNRDNLTPHYSNKEKKGVGYLVNSFLDSLIKIIISAVNPLDLEEFEEEYGEWGGDYYKRVKEFINEGYDVYEGSLATDSDSWNCLWNLEPSLAGWDLYIEGKDLRIYNSGI